MRTGAIDELQELRRKIYLTAKSEKSKCFWGLFCHVTKMETLDKAYKLAKQNNGSAGIDGVTFEDIEKYGVYSFIKEIREELISDIYLPTKNRKVGVPQGSVISPLFSNIYLNAIDRMFQKAKQGTARSGYENMEYCRFADDIVILINGHEAVDWLVHKSYRRLREELNKLKVNLNIEKTKIVNMRNKETFGFLGFEYRLVKNNSKKMLLLKPKKKKVQELRDKVKSHIKGNRDKTVTELIKELNPILQGWINYFRIGHCSRTFTHIKIWVEKKVRRFAKKAQKKFGFGWKEWSSEMIYDKWGLFSD